MKLSISFAFLSGGIRNYSFLFVFMLLICSLPFKTLHAQQAADSLNTGSIKGKAKDSMYNFMLTSATVAVYVDKDSSLVQYTLPNSFGEFTISHLPVNVLLRLVITHVGYKDLLRKFTISPDQKKIDFGFLYLYQQSYDSSGKMLEAVVVTSKPPMRMNGDTVEFNADAFRMAANATAEDLMRRLPGFTVWGDGEVTYNGKKINAILVEGKPFMGSSDPTVATQNLPKDALDKIQVYQQRDERNPLDSTMYANIKLKEDKQMGYFGKLSAGYGTDKRYTADGMMSGFNKKLQLNAVGALNNINKLANSTDVLIKNSSFKGEGTNIDYQSNFNMRGLNEPVAAGLKFQYDFIPDVQYRKSSRLNADYFFNNNDATQINNSLTNNFLKTDTVLSRKSGNVSNNQSRDQKLNARYTWESEYTNLSITSSLSESYDKNASQDLSEQEKTGMGIISSSLSRKESESTNRNIQMGAEYSNRNSYSYDNDKRIPTEFTIGYNFTAYDNDRYSRNQTAFTSNSKAEDNRSFDRIYEQRDASGATHTITARYPGLTRLLFNKHSFGGILMELSGNFSFKNDDYTDQVLDLDTLSKSYKTNTYLTNTRNVSTQNIQPAFNISKTFYKGLTNRYNKWLSIQAKLRQQYFSMDHRAVQSFQNFAYDYAYFVPDASIEYNNHQYGSYEVKYGLNFSTGVNYPGVNNIAPLVDSTNLWYIPKGNPNIKPQYKKDLDFIYTFTTRTPKNPLSFDLKIGIGMIVDNITDSSVYDNAGVRTVYAVNMKGNKYMNGEYGIRKSFEIKKNTTLEANGRYNIDIGQDPQYIDNVSILSKSTYHNIVLGLRFRNRDLLNLRAEQGMSIYDSKQEGFNNNRFKSTNSYTRLIGVLQFPKGISWGSNVTYNQNNSNNSASVYYTIWNASVTCRFLRENNGEIRFSALDLLRQNKGIVNTATANTQTFTTSNVLQHYYMLTLAYYPRQFGKKKSK